MEQGSHEKRQIQYDSIYKRYLEQTNHKDRKPNCVGHRLGERERGVGV